jgi:hypothetical protein
LLSVFIRRPLKQESLVRFQMSQLMPDSFSDFEAESTKFKAQFAGLLSI